MIFEAKGGKIVTAYLDIFLLEIYAWVGPSRPFSSDRAYLIIK